MEAAVLTVIKTEEALIVGNRWRMLPNRGLATGRQGQRVLPKRGELVPLLGRVTQDPLDRRRLVIDADEEVFSTRND